MKSHMLWRSLDHLPIGQGVLAEWQTMLATDFESTRPLLRSTDKIAGYYPAPNLDGHPWRVVEHGPDDFVAVCDLSGESIALAKRDVVVYELDFRQLSKEVAAAFEVTPMFEPVGATARCWRIGTISNPAVQARPLQLFVPANTSELQRALETIRAAGLELGTVIVPTRTCVQSTIEMLLSANHARLIVLEEALVARESGRWLMTNTPSEAVGAGHASRETEGDIPLCDRAQEILEAMYEMGSFDSDHRKTNSEITAHAISATADPNAQKEVFQ